MNRVSHHGKIYEVQPEDWETDETAVVLRSLPVVDPPAELFPAVMAKVTSQHKSEMPVFRLSWIDFALTLFFAGMIGLVMLLAGSLPPQVRLSLAWQLQWLQVMQYDWVLWPVVGLAAAACVAASIVFVTSMFSKTP